MAVNCPQLPPAIRNEYSFLRRLQVLSDHNTKPTRDCGGDQVALV
jgi:hypothetical protein